MFRSERLDEDHKLYATRVLGVFILYSPDEADLQVDLCLLATPFGRGLHALTLTGDDSRSLWWRLNLYARRRKFFTVWPPNLS